MARNTMVSQMKTRFVIMMLVAFLALSTLGLLAPTISHVLIGTFVIGLCMVGALSFWVLRVDEGGN